MKRDLVKLLFAASAAILAATLTACSSDGDGDGGTCQRAAVPSTGPGDTLDHFPAETGRTWTYRNESTAETAVMTVSGTQQVGTETASVFTVTSTGSAPTTELIVKRPAGVYQLADASAEPPFDQLYPTLLLPFPVTPGPETVQATCRALDIGDVDEDGKTDRADLTFTLQVLSATETATVPAGSFVDVAHVRSIARIKAMSSSSGTLDMVLTQDDWYAKGVGRVNSLATLAVPDLGYSESVTVSLQSWTVPGAALVAAPLAASGGGEPRRGAGFEERALRLVRSAFAASR